MKIRTDASIMAKQITIEVIIEKQSRIVFRIWMLRFVLRLAYLICPLKLYIVWPYDKSFRCSAGNACDFVQPYGWVPEFGCPIHDPDERDDPEEFEAYYEEFVRWNQSKPT